MPATYWAAGPNSIVRFFCRTPPGLPGISYRVVPGSSDRSAWQTWRVLCFPALCLHLILFRILLCCPALCTFLWHGKASLWIRHYVTLPLAYYRSRMCTAYQVEAP